MDRMKLVASEFVLSFLWVWAGSLVKLFIYTVGPATPHEAELLKIGLSIGYMFVFAWFDKLTGGGSYNPLTVLVYTVAGNGEYLFAAFCRIPTEPGFLFLVAYGWHCSFFVPFGMANICTRLFAGSTTCHHMYPLGTYESTNVSSWGRCTAVKDD